MRTPAAGLLLPTLLCLLFAPSDAQGQGRTGRSDDGTTAAARVGVRATSIRSEGTLLVGGAGLLRIAPKFAFGGGAWVLTEVLEIDGSEIGGGLGLRVAYGGVQTLVTPWRSSRLSVQVGLLLGAGNAKIELPAVGTEIAADNFLVFEPELSLDVRLAGALSAGGGVGYRAVAGVEDLAGVDEGQLRGGFATIGLVIGR